MNRRELRRISNALGIKAEWNTTNEELAYLIIEATYGSGQTVNIGQIKPRRNEKGQFV